MNCTCCEASIVGTAYRIAPDVTVCPQCKHNLSNRAIVWRYNNRTLDVHAMIKELQSEEKPKQHYVNFNLRISLEAKDALKAASSS